MKLFTKITAFVLSLILMFSITLSVNAATLDTTTTNAKKDVSLLAADFGINGISVGSDINLPSYYSSRDLGYTTAVRDQMYNSCWAYGAMATLETTMLKDGINIGHLSPTHLNHWGTEREDETGWRRDYIEGGYPYISLGYLSSWQGPKADSDYPESTSYSNFPILSKLTDNKVAVNGIRYLDSGDVKEVKEAVYKYGAIAANYHVDNSYYNDDTQAYYFNVEDLSAYQLNGHCISIVGWDDNFKKENFVETARPQNNGAWLCKNSWSEYWGDSGYFWISYEDTYLFDTVFGHNYVFTDYDMYDSSKTLYQNEIYGATFEFEYLDSLNNLTYINVFDTDAEYNLIEKVNFESTAVGAKYVIYIIPVNSTGEPTSKESEWTKIGSGTVSYQGYHSIDTTDYVVTDSKFAIGIDVTKANGSSNFIGVCEWLSDGFFDYIFMPQVDEGDSFIYSREYDELLDIKELYSDSDLNDDIGGTLVIKAVGSSSCLLGDANTDGSITILDATHIQRSLAKLTTLTEKQKALADMNQDGIINVLDATAIQRKLAQLD